MPAPTPAPTPTLCDHLQPLLDDLLRRGLKISYAGQAWSRNCRTWVYLEGIVLDTDSLAARFPLDPCIQVHTHRGTHDGSEHGLVCTEHHDALMGAHPSVDFPRIG